MDLQNTSVTEIFQNYLPKIAPNFEIREGQLEFAEFVEKTMRERGVLIAEAGTGTGKSYAYIVPAILQALQGKKIVIVTATIALQHQLAKKDIPEIQNLLGTSIGVQVLKGRSNYLCASRFDAYHKNMEMSIFLSDQQVRSLVKWREGTETGDKEEINTEGFQKFNDLWKDISTHDYSCGGRRCASRKYNGCFYTKARLNAKQASIVITNYSLFAQHIKLISDESDSKEGEGLLPDDAIYILDEAHKLRDILRDGFADSINSFEVDQMYSNLFDGKGLITLEMKARGGAFAIELQKKIDLVKLQFQKTCQQLDKIDSYVSTEFGALFKKSPENDFACLYENNHTILDMYSDLMRCFQTLGDIIDSSLRYFSEDDDLRDVMSKYKGWIANKQKVVGILSDTQKNNILVRSCTKIGTTNVYSYAVAPLNIDHVLRNAFFTETAQVVCTSATLTTNGSFDMWMNQNGVPLSNSTTTTVSIDSPFPYKKNVLLLVPEDAPLNKYQGPTQTSPYQEYLAKILPTCLDYSKGRALILCTSYPMVNYLASQLRKHEKKSNWTLLVQEKQVPNNVLSEQFRTTENSVLIATTSFWEGFDAPGDTLRLLVMVQLPFTSPNNLFFQQESKQLEMNGGNAFVGLSLPQAEIRLRQGFGRLMRSSHDSGIVLITDKRVMGYNQVLINSLPDCSKRTCTTKAMLQEIQAYFDNN